MSVNIKITTSINAPIKAVWDMLVTPSLWWDDVELEAKTGGKFEERWDGNITMGTVVVLSPPEELKLSWKDAGWPGYTYVTFLLTAKEQTTSLEFLHEGWGIFPPDEAKQLIHDHKGGWDMHLEDLKRACEKTEN